MQAPVCTPGCRRSAVLIGRGNARLCALRDDFGAPTAAAGADPAARARDRCIGVAPGIARRVAGRPLRKAVRIVPEVSLGGDGLGGVAGHMVMMMVMAIMVVMPGAGRGFGGGATHEQSSGYKRKRGTRAGDLSRRKLDVEHRVQFPLCSIAAFCGQWTPVRC